MPFFEIKQYEVHVQRYRVEASSAAAAIVQVCQGAVEPVLDGGVYRIGADMGLRVQDHPALAAELRTLGMSVGDGIIPSIHSVTEFD